MVAFLRGDDLGWGVKFICVGGEQNGIDKGTPYGNRFREAIWVSFSSACGINNDRFGTYALCDRRVLDELELDSWIYPLSSPSCLLSHPSPP